MKKVYFVMATLVLAGFLLSCSKQSINNEINPPSTNVVNTTIAPNQSYQFIVSEPGEVTVAKQARHFKMSEIGSGEESRQVIYKYAPEPNYSGIEEIILANKKPVAVIQSGGGCNSNHDTNPTDISYNTIYTIIRVNVTN